MTFSIATPLALFLLVVSCGQSSINDNNDSQEPSIKYIQTTAKRGNIDIKQVLNLDASTITTRQEVCDYLINNKNELLITKRIYFRVKQIFKFKYLFLSVCY